jgi:hypothetical protein
VDVGLTMMRKSRRQNAATYYGEAQSGKAAGTHAPNISERQATEESFWTSRVVDTAWQAIVFAI